MQSAWALLLPSVKEGWGIVVSEAAACGTPAIVTDVSGLRDSVRPGETGLVVPADATAEQLAAELLRIAGDAGLRDRLGTAAAAWAARLDWDVAAEQLEAVLLARVRR
jgi:glycosyltransferase involved in cell wall biosynthesis